MDWDSRPKWRKRSAINGSHGDGLLILPALFVRTAFELPKNTHFRFAKHPRNSLLLTTSALLGTDGKHLLLFQSVAENLGRVFDRDAIAFLVETASDLKQATGTIHRDQRYAGVADILELTLEDRSRDLGQLE